MTLFTPDLYRNIAIGFVLGAALVAGANIEAWSDELAPPAQAAELPETPQPSPAFWTSRAR